MAARVAVRTLVIAALGSPPCACAVDILLTPPAGGGVSITNAAGNTTRFRVADDGSITMPGLGAVPVPSTGLCVEIATGKVGTCSTGSGIPDSLSLAGNLTLVNSTATSGNVLKGASRFIHDYGVGNTFLGLDAGNFMMAGGYNTGVGTGVLAGNTTGHSNTGVGNSVLLWNATGTSNTAVGNAAMLFNTAGIGNTAAGASALSNNTTGGENTAAGAYALVLNTVGGGNTAVGHQALHGNTAGGLNTALGGYALQGNTSGGANIAIGYAAGQNLTTGGFNIAIGHAGVAGEGNTLRIGTAGNQTRAFVAGIRGVTPALPDALPVVIDSAGQLGTASAGASVASVSASPPLASSGGATPNISLTGTIPVANGGTGATALASNGVLYGQGTGAVGTVVGAAGQVLTGVSGGAPAWTSSPSLGGSLTLVSSTAANGNILKGASPFIHNFGADNTFVGVNAGNFTTSGVGSNTAIGVQSLTSITTGNVNTATGWGALQANTTGSWNTASGTGALTANVGGTFNTAAGGGALGANVAGNGNSAFGYHALQASTGESNTAVGINALGAATGNSNVALGALAGINLTTGDSNIAIGNPGVAGESNTTRIGGQFTHTRTFVSGIRDVSTGAADAIAVLVDSNGQLGTVSSSAMVKDHVADMADASSALMKLRPVTFRYTQYGPESRVQYGLIAEEVERVYPGLVAKRSDGSSETVMYHFLPPMLLNEYQKQQRMIENQAARIAELERRTELLIQALERRVP